MATQGEEGQEDRPPSPAGRKEQDRLSLTFPSRLTLCTVLAATTGLGLGSTLGGQSAGLRFRAENAHRLPSSEVGWFLYHKSKNYHVMLGAAREGCRMSLKLGLWSGLFFWTEECVDRTRGAVVRGWVGFRDHRRRAAVVERGAWAEEVGLEEVETEEGALWVQRDFLSTTVAALGTAGAWSVWNRFSVLTAARTARTALKFGVTFGLLQDLLGYYRGRRVGYIDFVKRRFPATRTSSVSAEAVKS